MQKRTQRLADEALVEIQPGIVVQAGGEHGLALTPAQREELQHNLDKAGPLRSRIERLTQDLLTRQAAFIDGLACQLSPGDIARFNVRFDGGDVVARLGESVLAVCRFALPPCEDRTAVLLTLENMRAAARSERESASLN